MTKKRKHYSGAQKVEILKRHLVDGEEISKICDELRLNPTVFYDWQKRFFENGARAFESESQSEEKQLKSRVQTLEAKLIRKDEVLAELMEEHVALKKSLGET